MVAVGIAHRLFMAPSNETLQNQLMCQYNKAIAFVVRSMWGASSRKAHVSLICCLLFISIEGLTGRYHELLRHLGAANKLFHTELPGLSTEEREVSDGLAEMFCRVGVEASNFMEEDPELSGLETCYARGRPSKSWDDDRADLDVAAFELRQIEFQIQERPWHFEDEHNSPENTSSNEFQTALNRWGSRFDTLVNSTTHLSFEEGFHYRSLRLRQAYWQMAIDAYGKQDGKSDPSTFAPFLEAASAVAAPIIALRQPTFSLDGNLISGLSFVVSTTTCLKTKEEALGLLGRLNRREGILDSRDMLEMYELSDLVDAHGLSIDRELSKAQNRKDIVGIPRVLEVLRKTLKGFG